MGSWWATYINPEVSSTVQANGYVSYKSKDLSQSMATVS
jgi:hypothetical protein